MRTRAGAQEGAAPGGAGVESVAAAGVGAAGWQRHGGGQPAPGRLAQPALPRAAPALQLSVFAGSGEPGGSAEPLLAGLAGAVADGGGAGRLGVLSAGAALRLGPQRPRPAAQPAAAGGVASRRRGGAGGRGRPLFQPGGWHPPALDRGAGGLAPAAGAHAPTKGPLGGAGGRAGRAPAGAAGVGAGAAGAGPPAAGRATWSATGFRRQPAPRRQPASRRQPGAGAGAGAAGRQRCPLAGSHPTGSRAGARAAAAVAGPPGPGRVPVAGRLRRVSGAALDDHRPPGPAAAQCRRRTAAALLPAAAAGAAALATPRLHAGLAAVAVDPEAGPRPASGGAPGPAPAAGQRPGSAPGG